MRAEPLWEPVSAAGLQARRPPTLAVPLGNPTTNRRNVEYNSDDATEAYSICLTGGARDELVGSNTARNFTPNTGPMRKPVQDWNEDDVEDWLVRFTTVPSDLAEVVRAHAISGMVMLTLKEEDLESLNIKFGHRRLLMLAADELRRAFGTVASVNQGRPLQHSALMPFPVALAVPGVREARASGPSSSFQRARSPGTGSDDGRLSTQSATPSTSLTQSTVFRPHSPVQAMPRPVSVASSPGFSFPQQTQGRMLSRTTGTTSAPLWQQSKTVSPSPSAQFITPCFEPTTGMCAPSQPSWPMFGNTSSRPPATAYVRNFNR